LTALALAPGALNTGMPRALMAGTGMLLTPAPAAADGFHAGRNLVIVKAERPHDHRIW
jgi:hypothetical protein